MNFLYCIIAFFIVILLLRHLLREILNAINEVKETLQETSLQINDDIYDIKKHLNLPVKIRTLEQQGKEVYEYVNRRIKEGKTKTEILKWLNDANSEGHFGAKTVGLININEWKEYIEAEQKLYGKPLD